MIAVDSCITGANEKRHKLHDRWPLTTLIQFHWNHWYQVAGAWSERQKMFHGGSFLKLADDDV